MNKYIYIGNYKIAPYNPDKDGAYLIISSDVLEVVKEPTHNWKVNQILVEGEQFKIEVCKCKIGDDCPYRSGKWFSNCKIAVPIKSIVEESLEEERLGDDLEPEVHGND